MYSYRKEIKNSKYFKIEELFNDYITHYSKKFDLYLVECEFEVEFFNLTDFLKTG